MLGEAPPAPLARRTGDAPDQVEETRARSGERLPVEGDIDEGVRVQAVYMVGMLRSTLVLRRFDQNPSSIVTARTGTLCNFAYGEFAVLITP